MSTEPDEWEDDRPEPAGPPGLIRAAGILWMVIGVLFILSGCANVVMSAVLKAQQPNRPAAGGEGCGLFLALGIGAACFGGGRNLLTGKSKDVVTAAVLSILLGLFYLLLAVGSLFVILPRNPALGLGLAAVGSVVAFGCILSAILALAGRSQYREWRRARYLARRARRRREDEEYEDDRDDRREDDGDDRDPGARPWDRGRGPT